MLTYFTEFSINFKSTNKEKYVELFVVADEYVVSFQMHISLFIYPYKIIVVILS
jgi:hypothetical protein